MYFLDEVVNIRESKDKKKILVSFMESGKVKVKRFFLDKCPVERCREEKDAVYEEDENGKRFVSVINLIRMRKEYENMNEDEALKLFLYLTAQSYAALIANQRRAKLMDRTQVLNDSSYESRQKRREIAYKYYMKRTTKLIPTGVRVR